MPISGQILAALVMLALGGCTSVSSFQGIPLSGESLYVSGLPPLRQNAQYACGPVCVAAVAAHWGTPLDEFKARCPSAPQDTTGQELQTLAESLGLRAFVFQGSLDEVRANLRQGRPLIVMITKPPDQALRRMGLLGGIALALSEKMSRPSHWVVVIGFTAEQEVIVHDPAAGLLRIKPAAFEQWWAEQKNLCVLVAGN